MHATSHFTSTATRPRAQPDSTNSNTLLQSLPPHQRERLSSHLQPVVLPLGLVLHHELHHEREAIERVYLLDSGMASLILTTQGGVTVEVGIVAREGVA